MPVRSTRHAGVRVVLGLMTGAASHRGDAVPVVPALDIETMEMPVVTLARTIAGRMAVDATLMRQNSHHLVEGRRGVVGDHRIRSRRFGLDEGRQRAQIEHEENGHQAKDPRHQMVGSESVAGGTKKPTRISSLLCR